MIRDATAAFIDGERLYTEGFTFHAPAPDPVPDLLLLRDLAHGT